MRTKETAGLYSVKVLEALRSNAETTKEQGAFSDVYLDNAKADLPMLTLQQFAGYLSALERAGLYRKMDDGENNGIWGQVLM